MYIDANKKDPDTYSETLHKYHGLLWNKKLPTGRLFDLEKIELSTTEIRIF